MAPMNVFADRSSAAVPRCKHTHDWHSLESVRDWRTRDAKRAEERERWLTRLIAAAPFAADATIQVLDVGGGYGAVSKRVLQAFPCAAVTLHDYSQVMFDQARDALSGFTDRVRYVRADLRDAGWTTQIGGPFDLVVSALCIHNTLDMAVIGRCYRDVHTLLKPGGCFLDYDHYDHIGTVDTHLALFAQGGYERVESLFYEPPTAIIRAWA